jgi:anaerobic selenocysteine-containing dehydrogenase
MNHYELTVHSPRRLLTPLVRTGPKGSGTFSPITWDDAIDRIATRWRQIIASHGGEAILPYSYAGTMGLVQRNSGHPFFHRLGASRLERAICSPAKGAGWKTVMGDTPTVDPDEVAESDLILLWGINAVATSIHFMHGVTAAKRRGARVWLIDTYRTPTAGAADETILIRPGSDGALALGIMHLLQRDGLIDPEFIAANVLGYDGFAREILPEYTPARVAELTGIPAATVEELATAYGRAEAPFIRLGSGLSRYGNGAMTVRTIACLPALVGAYGKKGGGCFPDTATGGAFAMQEVTREDFMTTPTRVINMNRLGEALTGLADPPVMSLYVYHSNPAAVAPDQNTVIRGLCRDDLFTVVHERFMTDSARYADIVLPATSSLEQSDIYRAYGTYLIQRAKRVIPPLGESKSNWETFSLLAAAMGFEEPFFRQSADTLIDHLLSLPSPLRTGIDRQRLAQGRAVRLSVATGQRHFLTPSGKIEIFSQTDGEPYPRYLPTHEETGNYPLRLMTAPTRHGLNASFNERDDLRAAQGGMKLLLSGEDARSRNLQSGDLVRAWNDVGEVEFYLEVSTAVPPGVAVAEGVWWIEFAPGTRTVNALVSQRLTDRGNGSTFYDNRIEVKKG